MTNTTNADAVYILTHPFLPDRDIDRDSALFFLENHANFYNEDIATAEEILRALDSRAVESVTGFDRGRDVKIVKR